MSSTRRCGAGIRACGVLFTVAAALAQDARQIVEESQRRGRSNSQRYEGVLEVLRRMLQGHEEILESMCASAPTATARRSSVSPRRPKSKAWPCWWSTIPDRSCDQWMWTPAIGRERRIAFRIAPRDSSAPISASRISKSATSINTTTGSPARKLSTARPAGASRRGRAQGKTSQYTLTRMWIRKDNYVAAQYENFIKEQPVRRLRQSDIQNLQGIWTRAHARDDRPAPQEPHSTADREAGI